MLVLLDASAVTYLLEGDASTVQAVRRTLATLHGERDPPPLAVSALSRLECRARPLRENDTAALQRLDQFFGDPGLLTIALDITVLDCATELRASHGLRTPDAIQAASLLVANPDGVFVTGDNDFERIPGLNVRRIRL